MAEKIHHPSLRFCIAVLAGFTLIFTTLSMTTVPSQATPEPKQTTTQELPPDNEEPTEHGSSPATPDAPEPAETSAHDQPSQHAETTRTMTPDVVEHSHNTEVQRALNLHANIGHGNIVISGTGFSPHGLLDFTIDSHHLGSTLADSTGEIDHTVHLPDLEPGNSEVTALDRETGREATVDLVIPQTDQATLNPEVTVDPTEVHPGEAVNVSGSDFATGHIEILLDGDSLIETSSDAEGNFSAIAQLSQHERSGEHTLIARDEDGNEATAQFTIVEGDPDADLTELKLTSSTMEVHIGDTIRLRLEGPEEFLAAHSTEQDGQDLTPHSELTNTFGQKGVFTESGPTLVDSGEGYRTFEYLVPDFQPTNNAFDNVGAITHGVYFTFFTRVDATAAPGDTDDAIVTSNELTIVVHGIDAAENAVDDTEEFSQPVIDIEPNTIDIEAFIGDPDDGAGVRHIVHNLAPNTEIRYTVNGPDRVEALTQSATTDEDGAVEFWIHGYTSAEFAVYLGKYTTAVTHEHETGPDGELAGNFTVTGDAPARSVPVSGNEASLGTSMPATGGSSTTLLVLTGALLAAGGAIVAFTNRDRLFGPKEEV